MSQSSGMESTLNPAPQNERSSTDSVSTIKGPSRPFEEDDLATPPLASDELKRVAF